MDRRVLSSEEKASPAAKLSLWQRIRKFFGKKEVEREPESKVEADVGGDGVQEQHDVEPVVKKVIDRYCSCGAPSAVDHEMCEACKKESAKHLKEFLKNPAKGFMTNSTNGGPSTLPAGTCFGCDQGQDCRLVGTLPIPEPIRYWDGTQYLEQRFDEPDSPAFMKAVLDVMKEKLGPEMEKLFAGISSDEDED